MAILWTGSLVPWIDPSGDPYAGALAYFFDSGTTTPKVTYTDSALSIPHDHPVEADSAGMFPAIFLVEQTTYRVRITDADGATLHDVNGISVPTTVPPDPPSGSTDAEFLYQTGDIKMAWRSAAPTGYVRCNGRTIGSASSGATERANADTSALFQFLWTQDANLTVSGGRGGSAASDFAANKTIALPDFRGRVPAGLDSMGNSASNRITDAQLGSDSDTLGSAGGASTVTLATGDLPSHSHNAGTLAVAVPTKAPRDGWTTTGGSPSPGGGITSGRVVVGSGAAESSETLESLRAAGADVTLTTPSDVTASGATATAGSGTAHANLQPTVMVPFFIKL